MARGQVVILAANVLLQAFDFVREELDRAAAIGTKHVMVAAPVVLVLIAGNAVVKCDLAGRATFGEQLERAVDSGVAGLGVFCLNQPVQCVGRTMIASLDKCADGSV